MLSLTSKNCFYIYKANLTNIVFIVDSLQILFIKTFTFTSNYSKQLKLTTLITIIDKACN